MTREEKTQVVAELTEVISQASGMYFTDFAAMNAEQSTKLRQELRKAGLQYKVAKNTLIKIALREQGKLTPELEKALIGQTGIAFGFDDPVAPARIIKDFAEKNQDKPALKAATLEGVVYPGSALKTIAALPSRQDLMASIVGSIAAPISGLAGVLGAVQRDLVYVIDAIEKKKGEA
jgi:large subunit ribosomal protein L10